MPTTPRGLYYPDDTTNISPLHPVLAAMQTSTDTVLTQYGGSFATEAARDAVIPSPVAGMFATTGSNATQVLWISSNSTIAGWVPMASGWQTYTPTLTGVTLGTGGTISGSWHYTGMGEITGYMTLTLGTGGLFTGTPSFGLPVSCGGIPNVSATARDNSTAARRIMGGILASSTALNLIDASAGFVTATVPWTWAVSDSLAIAYIVRGT